MRESGYQSKIIKTIKAEGGWAVNGNFTTDGEPDLQCGIPLELPHINHIDDDSWELDLRKVMLYVAVEVKTEEDYHRVMRGIDENYNVIDKAKLKSHETLQMAKIREIRKRGGLALVAYNYKQIMEYIDKEMK